MDFSIHDSKMQQNYFVSASSAVSGSAKRLDYKGFIELVKYFDNSLFKMLKNFWFDCVHLYQMTSFQNLT
jgi:hypothetical protein